MDILQKIKSWFNYPGMVPEYIFNGIQIEFISPIVVDQISRNESKYLFKVHFSSGLVVTVQRYTHLLEEPPILLSIRELFINGIGHSYIALYADDIQGQGVQIIREYKKN